MPVSDAQKKAKKKYEASAYETVTAIFKKGERERIKAFAQSQGKSLNGFVVDAIKKSMSNENEQT